MIHRSYVLAVNRDCLVNGRRGAPDFCPIALAAKNIGLKGIAVGPGTMSFYDLTVNHNERLRANLPLEAKNFISAFDDGHDVQPFTFTVTP